MAWPLFITDCFNQSTSLAAALPRHGVENTPSLLHALVYRVAKQFELLHLFASNSTTIAALY